MIDIHLHLVPAVDDGAANLEQAVELCRLAAADGCELLVATPHRRRDEWPDRPVDELQRRLDEVRDASGGEPRLLLGSEIRVDSDLLRDLARPGLGGCIPLGGTRALLLEFEPEGVGPDPLELIAELVARAWLPVVAHPELTPFLHHDLDLVTRLVEAGALLQVTAASVTGELGKPVGRVVAELFDRGLVQFVASDAHRPDWRPPGLARARATIEKRWGGAVATAVTATNALTLFESRPLRQVGVAS